MKRIYKSISLMLALILVLAVFPVSALAANNEDVITSISHTSAVSASVNEMNNTVTITVPYSFIGDLLLSDGLDISYNKSVYAFASANFPNVDFALVGGPSVKMIVIYQRKNDDDFYTAEYAVSVVRASQAAPSFSGVISKTVKMPNIITFTLADFTAKYLKNDGTDLSSIYIAGSDPSFGTLKLAGVSALGKIITAANLQSGSLTFVPSGTGSVSYSVSAYAFGVDTPVGIAILSITATELSDDSDPFPDVDKDVFWAVEAINYLYNEGIITGDGNGRYNPRASISKGDFMLMLSRAFELDYDFVDNFADVKKDDYFYDAVGKAKGLGIAKGANGSFNPRSSLSRGDAMVLLVRTLEVRGITLPVGSDSDLQPFKDKNKISDYAKDAFSALIKAGIIEGTGKFLNPNSSISRAEIAVILYRILTTYSALL